MNRLKLLAALLVLFLPSVTMAAPPADADSGDGTARLVTCLAPAADVSPVYATTTFPADIRKIAAVFRLGEDEAIQTLTSRWIAVDVGDAAPPNFEIAKADLPLQGRDRGSFRLSLPQDFPVGTYRLEVLADGQPWQTVNFNIVAPVPLELASAEELYPLTVGRIARYQFVMSPGPGLKLSLPGITPDRQGNLRADVTISIVGTDDHGTRFELRRNNELIFQEWKRWSDEGLVATRRQPLDQTVVLDPPQPLLRSQAGFQEWEYASNDQSIRAAFRMWGPVPVQGPNGTAPGFVTFSELPPDADGTEVTVERHFLPGLAMVRETAVTARDGHLITRQELVRQKDR